MVLQLHGRELNIDKIRERLELTHENNRLLIEASDEIGDFEYRRVGSLDIAFTETEWEHLNHLVSFQKRAGDEEIQLLDKTETRELMPALTQNIFGSRYRPTDGNLNPLKLIHNLAQAAKKQGACIYTQTKVQEIIEEAGRVKGIRTAQGETRAEWVVSATNAWASQLTKEVEVAPLRELASITEVVPPFKNCIFEAGYGDIFTWGTTQTASGNVIMGGPGAPAPRGGKYNYYDEVVTLSEVKRCARYLVSMFPSLSKVNILRCWAGTSAFTPDVIPSIGPLPGKQGLVVAVGFAAGMSHALATGKAMAEYIESGRINLPNIYDPARFSRQKVE
ncbi:Hydrogen cyanide synthase subunit HcnC [subsurface metagenome]